MSTSTPDDDPTAPTAGDEGENWMTYPESYLPLGCPRCGRRRLLARVRTDEGRGFVVSGTVRCEKCGWSDV